MVSFPALSSIPLLAVTLISLINQQRHTDYTVHDEPAWSISTTRGFPTSEKTGDDTERRTEQEYLIFASFYLRKGSP